MKFSCHRRNFQNSESFLKQKRFLYKAEAPSAQQEIKTIAEANKESPMTYPTETTGQAYDRVIKDIEGIVNREKGGEKAKDAQYIADLEATAKGAKTELLEAKERSAKNNEYLSAAASVKVGLDKTTINLTTYEHNTHLSEVATTLEHSQFDTDTLYNLRTKLKDTAPSGQLAEEKSDLLGQIENQLTLFKALENKIIKNVNNEIDQYDETIQKLTTDSTPNLQDIRELQKGEALLKKCLGKLQEDETGPAEIIQHLEQKIGEIRKALDAAGEMFIKDSPQLKTQYDAVKKANADFDKALEDRAKLEEGDATVAEKDKASAHVAELEQNKTVENIGFQLDLTAHATGPLLKEIEAAHPPSLNNIRVLQGYVNNTSEYRDQLKNLPNQKDARIPTLLQKVEEQLKDLNQTLNAARDEYFKTIGSPENLSKLMAKGTELQQKIEECKKKLAEAPDDKYGEVLQELENLQKLRDENNHELHVVLSGFETARLVSKLKGDEPVLYTDIVDLQNFNNSTTNDVIKNAKERFFKKNLSFEKEIKLLGQLESALGTAKEKYEKLSERDVKDPAKIAARKELTIARANYFKQKNRCTDLGRAADKKSLQECPPTPILHQGSTDAGASSDYASGGSKPDSGETAQTKVNTDTKKNG